MGLNFSKINNSWDYKKAHMNLDNFATFRWRGAESFNDYHTFIVSGRDELKFYNGPSFSNEYTTPQFQSSSGNITRIKFNRQTLSFKIGIYWFTAEDYQYILNWLNAYEIDYLTFDFNPDYSYLVKLTGRSDSQRTFLGYDNNSNPVYYTEMTLNWELQGPSGLRKNEPKRFNINSISEYSIEGVDKKVNGQNILFSTRNVAGTEFNDKTFLRSPLIYTISFSLALSGLPNGSEKLFIKMLGCKTYGESETEQGRSHISILAENGIQYEVDETIIQEELFNLVLENLPWYINNSESYNTIILTLTYDSEAGLIYYQFGNSPRKLLTLLTTVNEGKNLVETLSIFKYWLSGQDTDSSKKGDFFIIQMELTQNESPTGTINIENNNLYAYCRTNVI